MLACIPCPTLIFFFNHTATPEIYTLSLHDALPISPAASTIQPSGSGRPACRNSRTLPSARSEEHTSELQSHVNLVCRLLLEKKKKKHLCFFVCKKKKI